MPNVVTIYYLRYEHAAVRQEAAHASEALTAAAAALAEGKPVDQAALDKVPALRQRVEKLRQSFKEYGDTHALAADQNPSQATFSALASLLENFAAATTSRRAEVEHHLARLKNVPPAPDPASPDLNETVSRIQLDAAQLLEQGKTHPDTELPLSWVQFHAGTHPLGALVAYFDALEAKDLERADTLEETIDKHYGKRFRRRLSQGWFRLPPKQT